MGPDQDGRIKRQRNRCDGGRVGGAAESDGDMARTEDGKSNRCGSENECWAVHLRSPFRRVRQSSMFAKAASAKIGIGTARIVIAASVQEGPSLVQGAIVSGISPTWSKMTFDRNLPANGVFPI